MKRLHLREALIAFISTLPEHCCDSFPFKNSVPGYWFLLGFEKRHRRKLRFGRPLCQEAKRWSAVNAETLTKHYAVFEKLVRDKAINASRLWNLDETGCTPGQDASGQPSTRGYLCRNCTDDVVLPEWVLESRITLLPVVRAKGDTGPPLLIFDGSKRPYRETLIVCEAVIFTLSSHLPLDATIAMRKEGGGIDALNFYNCAKLFLEYVRPLTTGGVRSS